MHSQLSSPAIADPSQPGSLDYSDPAETLWACRRLWQSVLLMALRDIQSDNERVRQSAIHFLEGGAAKAIADHAGILRSASRLSDCLDNPPYVPHVVIGRI